MSAAPAAVPAATSAALAATSAAPAAQDSEELRMEAMPAEEELGPAGALGSRSRLGCQLTAGPVQSPWQRHSPVSGHIATGLGPDWSDDRDVGRVATG
jgi:hypothetical protein